MVLVLVSVLGVNYNPERVIIRKVQKSQTTIKTNQI